MDTLARKSTIAGLALAFLLHRYFVHERQTLVGNKRSDDGRPRRIMITGAASGIGLETTKLFLARGWEVGMTDIDEKKVQALAKELGVSFARKLDVTDGAMCAAVVRDFCSVVPDMDAIFNSAGVLAIGMFADLDLKRQTNQIRINCEGIVNFTYAAVPYLRKRPKGEARIVTMASASAIHGIPQHAVYAATKAFVYSLTEALAIELAVDGISTADVSVLYVETPMVTQQERQDSSIMLKTQSRVQPQAVASRVWDAVHLARIDREHFFVETSTNFLFKLDSLMRAFGWRLASRITAYTNMP